MDPVARRPGLCVGIYLHFCTPTSSMPWVLLVLFAAFAGQELGAAWFGSQLSGFFGALAMTPLVLWFEHLPQGPPKLVTFLPAFWLLVPGAAGLIGITVARRGQWQCGRQRNASGHGDGDLDRARRVDRHRRLPLAPRDDTGDPAPGISLRQPRGPVDLTGRCPAATPAPRCARRCQCSSACRSRRSGRWSGGYHQATATRSAAPGGGAQHLVVGADAGGDGPWTC